MALSPLRLHLDAHRLALDADDAHATDEEAVVDPRAAAIGVVARSEDRGPVEPEDGADGRGGEVEGQAELVAGGQQVGACVQVRDDVVRRLGRQGGE